MTADRKSERVEDLRGISCGVCGCLTRADIESRLGYRQMTPLWRAAATRWSEGAVLRTWPHGQEASNPEPGR